jgi:hypothetical protein
MGGGALQTSNFFTFFVVFKLSLDNAITVEDPGRKLIYHRLLSLFFSLFIDKKAARYNVVSVPQKEDDFNLFFPWN